MTSPISCSAKVGSEVRSWSDFLYPERIWDIIAYIRTLHRPAAAKQPPFA